MARVVRNLVIGFLWVALATNGLMVTAEADDPPRAKAPPAQAPAPRYPDRPTITTPGLQQVAPVLDQVQLKLIKLENRIAALERELEKHRSVYAVHTHSLSRDISLDWTDEAPGVGGILTTYGPSIAVLSIHRSAASRYAITTPPR